MKGMFDPEVTFGFPTFAPARSLLLLEEGYTTLGPVVNGCGLS